MTVAFVLRVALAAVMVVASAAVEAGPAAIATVKNIVLVHGALTDGSSWRGVYDILTRDGYHVSVVQEPLAGFVEDVAATKRVIDRQEGPVILVGHSYGGAIITVAGADPKVRGLVYVAALQPDVGETVNQLARSMPGAAPSSDYRATTDGFASLDPAKFATDFAADLPPAQAKFMADSQMPIAAAAFDAAMTVAAWHDKPSYGIVATADRQLNPKLARWMYKRSGAKMTEINASHAVYISHPGAVAGVIERAARSVRWTRNQPAIEAGEREAEAMATHNTGTREQWLAARIQLLKAEKELTRYSHEVARQRQELPWVRVEKIYWFETEEGDASLADLFRGRLQLLVYLQRRTPWRINRLRPTRSCPTTNGLRLANSI